MCLITFALDAHPEYPFIFAANRDEFFDRPSLPATFWDHAPAVLSGIDERAGGTWCGIRRDGRFTCVTNFREPPDQKLGLRSRGMLTRRFLLDDAPPDEYAREARREGERYAGFNLLVGDRGGLYYASNRAGSPTLLGPGVYGMSNHLLNTQWPKVVRARASLSSVIDDGMITTDRLIEVLLDDTPAADDDLPETGFGRAWERVLSPIFIRTPDYGTRCSTAILVSADGHVTFHEVQHLPGRPSASARRYEFRLQGVSA
jgi:uncharacterized protein with NRDE domain